MSPCCGLHSNVPYVGILFLKAGLIIRCSEFQNTGYSSLILLLKHLITASTDGIKIFSSFGVKACVPESWAARMCVGSSEVLDAYGGRPYWSVFPNSAILLWHERWTCSWHPYEAGVCCNGPEHSLCSFGPPAGKLQRSWWWTQPIRLWIINSQHPAGEKWQGKSFPSEQSETQV